MKYVIFGRSPFINEIDIPLASLGHTTLGINSFGHHYPVDFSFMYDRVYPVLSGQTVGPEWLKVDIPIVIKARHKPFYPNTYQHKRLVLSFQYFTVSIAVNWAILHGPSAIYLVGIDHDEADQQFERFDGDTQKTFIKPEAHTRVKRFIEFCSEVSGIPIYQTNPDAKGWNLPYANVEDLYETKA